MQHLGLAARNKFRYRGVVDFSGLRDASLLLEFFQGRDGFGVEGAVDRARVETKIQETLLNL